MAILKSAPEPLVQANAPSFRAHAWAFVATVALLALCATGCPDSELLVKGGADCGGAGTCEDTAGGPIDSGEAADAQTTHDTSQGGGDDANDDASSSGCPSGGCPSDQTCYRGACYPNCASGGSCGSGKFCRMGACVPADQCQPVTCQDVGADCGRITDKCGGTLTCGTCQKPETCGGGGKPNQCGEPETCDGKDNNNDGVVDEGCPCDYKGLSNGVCTKGVKNGSGTCTKPRGFETDEFSCDGIDNDCDGEVDEATPSGGGIACQPGSTDTQDCSQCGTKKRTCLKSCTWGNWGACQNRGPCKPGATEQQRCGRCGMQTRTCGQNCQWKSWGTCRGQGQCRSGNTQSQSCRRCGTRTRSCTASCTWQPWSTCRNQGVCRPGATSTQGCPGQCMAKKCDSSCSWSRSCTECVCQQFTQCGYSCMSGYHISARDHDPGCGGAGLDDNSVTCTPNCGRSFTACGSQCPTGYHPTRRTRSISCGTGSIRDNAVICQIN